MANFEEAYCPLPAPASSSRSPCPPSLVPRLLLKEAVSFELIVTDSVFMSFAKRACVVDMDWRSWGVPQTWSFDLSAMSADIPKSCTSVSVQTSRVPGTLRATAGLATCPHHHAPATSLFWQ